MAEIKDKLITAENLKKAYDDNKRQITELKDDLVELESKTSEIANSNLMCNTTFVVGYVDENGIYFDSNTNYVVSDYIRIERN